MAKTNMYDMFRAKAKDMGHKAAKLSDDVWQKYADAKDRRQVLREAKLYVENYMLGNIEPSEFADMMAYDDRLRYTVSDLCRMRLEPVTLDVERGNGYVDVGAGVKTFWTEIKVPLPSETNAARDLYNISLGIEAGRAAAGASGKEPGQPANDSHKKRTFSDILNDAKQRAAEKAIEKLTPIAEGRGRAPAEAFDEAWLATEDGREYHDKYTRRAAGQLENMAMSIEAGKDMGLHSDERKKAFEAAGVSDDMENSLASDNTPHKEMGIPASGFSNDELDRPLDEDMQALFDQIMEHVNQDRVAGKKNSKKQGQAGQQQDVPQETGQKGPQNTSHNDENAVQEPLFDESDEALMHYYMGSDESGEERDGPPAFDSPDEAMDYYFQAPYADDGDVELSPEDCAALFDGQEMSM